eukprot:15476813-Alexandrium_andersonii.AAC.1
MEPRRPRPALATSARGTWTQRAVPAKMAGGALVHWCLESAQQACLDWRRGQFSQHARCGEHAGIEGDGARTACV